MSIYKHADIYPSLSPKRGKLIVDNSNYGLNMVAKSIEISAKINNKSVTCTPNLRMVQRNVAISTFTKIFLKQFESSFRME